VVVVDDLTLERAGRNFCNMLVTALLLVGVLLPATTAVLLITDIWGCTEVADVDMERVLPPTEALGFLWTRDIGDEGGEIDCNKSFTDG